MIGCLPRTPGAVWCAGWRGKSNGKTQDAPAPDAGPAPQPYDKCICGCPRAFHHYVQGARNNPIERCVGTNCGGCSLFELLEFPDWLDALYERRKPAPMPVRENTGMFASLDAYPKMVTVVA